MHPQQSLMKTIPILATAALALGSSSCTIIDVDSDSSLPGLHVDGLVSGHVAFGMSDESGVLEASVLDGPSDGGILHLRISNLLGLEIGVLGAAFNIGPLHMGLGTLFYDPRTPYIKSDDVECFVEDCENCGEDDE